jgi:FKBP-type peptidyl-prolyl cis-trans isomerase SlyD
LSAAVATQTEWSRIRILAILTLCFVIPRNRQFRDEVLKISNLPNLKDNHMQIADNTVVSLDYTLKDDQGVTLDTSSNGEFVYLHGAQNIIAGLENALTGKTTGDEISVSVSPEEAYGERNDVMVQVVPQDMFEAGQTIEVGMQFHAESPEGDMITVTVTEVEGENVTVDGNHPLAGLNLNFDVKIVDVRPATEEEIAHGHVHGAGGHQH